jgi:CitMHS family citrate-Mg2+:H+ or citrate-Ca2+:H+ symporter
MFLVSYWFGKREEKRLGIGCEAHQGQELAIPRFELTDAQRAVRRPKLFWFNIVMTVAIILAMILRIVDAAVAFMIGLALALSINYPKMDDQMARIEAHAKPALIMGSILLSAGAFVGVMKNTGIISAMAYALVGVIPSGAEGHIPFILGLFSAPLSLFFDPDSFYFGVLPVIAEAYKTLGGDPVLVARAATLGVYSTGFGITPLTPTCLLLIGLTRLNLADHQRFSLPYLWGSSIFMTLVAAAIGVFPF